jgi:hypothetical protein
MTLSDGFSQDSRIVRGRVLDENDKVIESALLIYLPGGKSVFSDNEGRFEIEKPAGAEMLVISASGYKRDTLLSTGSNPVIRLKAINRLKEEVLITGERNPGQLNFRSAALEIIIDRNEMRKAACCNLSESFESSPMVDVSFPDPLTGVRQIKMLGLGTQYTGYSIENQVIPNGVLGASYASLIPGPWLQSIQVQKGTGSVASGYSALSGQINSDFPKSDSSAKTELNAFSSTMSRNEANLVTPLRRSAAGGTTLFLHGNHSWLNMDANKDGYRDLPVGNQMNAMIRSRHGTGNRTFSISAHGYRDERTGGITSFNGKNDPIKNGFGFSSIIRGADLSGKTGFIGKGSTYRSLGILWSGGMRSNHQTAGSNRINLDERYFSIDPVLQADLGKAGNGIKTGISISGRQRDEILEQKQYEQILNYRINEQRAGAYLEFTSVPAAGLVVVAGSRIDWHSLYGWRHSPRLHIRYENSDDLIIRLAAGQAWHDPEILARNLPYFSSGRRLNVLSEDASLPYGLNAERGRSMGASAVWSYRILPGKGSISADAYLNSIDKQIIADAETNGILSIYNASSKAFNRSYSAQMDQKIGRRLAIRLACRNSVLWSQFNQGRLQAAMLSFNKIFLHLDYQMPNGIRANGTLQLNGKMRLYGTDEYSPSFFTANAQFSKSWNKGFELALGLENIGGFRQQNLVLFRESPASPEFDAARVWGPSVGMMAYLSLRYSLVQNQ